MKIFGIEFQTKNELREEVSALKNELNEMREVFPFTIGQTVYDVQLRNDKGRYVRKNASMDHSLINEVVVDKKNYFGLIERYLKHDVFVNSEDAYAYLKEVCVGN